MSEHRIEARHQGYAKVVFELHPGYLRNLTEEGCKIVMTSALPREVGEQLTIDIIPDETSGLSTVNVSGELRWVKNDAPYFIYGLHILAFGSDADAESYHKLVAQYGRG